MPRLRSLLTLLCVISTLQLGLLYVQGLQLHRQREALVDLRSDLQDLTESIDQLQGGQAQEDEAWSPSHARLRHRGTWLRVRQEPAEEDPAAKELRESRESGQKAVQEARQAQKKLSLEEASKRAEEKQKIEAAENAWMKWVWGGLAVVVVALLLRGWLRNRG